MLEIETILANLKNIEAWANGLALECKKTRKLIEEGVSTSTETGLSKIALEARKNLRARIIKAKKTK